MRFINRWRPSRALARSVALIMALAAMALVLQPSNVAGAPDGEPGLKGGAGALRALTGAATCDAATMQGVWAFHVTGTGAGQPLAAAGHEVFDGQGSTSLILTEVFNGHVDRLQAEGTYSVEPDCRGELSFRAEHADLPDLHTVDFYLSAGGERAFVILTGTDFVDVPGDDLSALPADSITLSGVLERLSAAETSSQD